MLSTKIRTKLSIEVRILFIIVLNCDKGIVKTVCRTKPS